MQQQKFARLGKISGFHPIELHAAGEILGVKLHIENAGLLLTILEQGNLLAEGVVNAQDYVCTIGQAVADRRRGVEGVGVVLAQNKFLREFRRDRN